MDRQVKEGKNNFYIGESEKHYNGIVTFKPQGNGVIDVNHTFVKPELRNQGLALKLIEAVKDYVEKNNLKVHPSCPYAKAVFEQNYPEFIAK